MEGAHIILTSVTAIHSVACLPSFNYFIYINFILFLTVLNAANPVGIIHVNVQRYKGKGYCSVFSFKLLAY